MADIIGVYVQFPRPQQSPRIRHGPGADAEFGANLSRKLGKDLTLLNAALDSQDTEPVQRLLHSLKGYVTFLCGPELSQQMIQLEAMSRAKKLGDLAVDIAKAIPPLQSLLSEVGQWIEKDLKPAT